MDLRAIQRAVAPLVAPFIPCTDQIPNNVASGEFAYVGLPISIEPEHTLAGTRIGLVNMAVTLCFPRVDDAQAQTQLSTVLSSGLLTAFDIGDTELLEILAELEPPIEAKPWQAIQIGNVDKFRVAEFTGTGEKVIACDLNFHVRPTT